MKKGISAGGILMIILTVGLVMSGMLNIHQEDRILSLEQRLIDQERMFDWWACTNDREFYLIHVAFKEMGYSMHNLREREGGYDDNCRRAKPIGQNDGSTAD